MSGVLRVEFEKLKGGPFLVISTLVMTVFPVLMSIMFVLIRDKLKVDEFTWSFFLGQNTGMLAMFIGTLLFGLVASYIFGREFVDDTAKNLFTLPVRRESVTLSKFLVLLLCCLGLAAVSFAISLVSGWIIGLSGFTWLVIWKAWTDLIFTVLLIYLTLPVTALVAMAGRGYLPPMGWAAAITVVSILMLNGSVAGRLFPWSLPAIYAIDYGIKGLPFNNTGLLIAVLVFVIGIIANLVYIRQAEIGG